MHLSQFARPAPCLEQFVRFYVQREARIHSTTVVHPVPARPTPMLVFDFADPTDVFLYGEQAVKTSPLTVVVGPQTFRRLEMRLQGTINTFAISLQPDGMHTLFSIPAHELADHDFEAHSVLGSFVTLLGERLGNSSSFSERVRIAEEVLLPRALASGGLTAISAAIQRIILTSGRESIPALAARSGFSVRQFERRFIQQVGMRPKLFARIARFEAALENKARFATKSWTDISYAFGYFDQMHMVHDFAEFTGETPTKILQQLEAVFVEQIRTFRSSAPYANDKANARLVL